MAVAFSPERIACERATDLEVAQKAARAVDNGDDFFVLTGSYAIEVVTEGTILHNDIDANVFTRDVPAAMARVGFMLAGSDVLPNATRLEDTKPDRLEYVVGTADIPRKLELQFVAFDTVHPESEQLVFSLPTTETREISVPTIEKTLSNAQGEALQFRVKSLPYAIATWALRISGVAQAQKRDVRQTDIDHFAFLVGAPHDAKQIIHAMERHPQMNADYSAQAVLAFATKHLDR